MPTFAEPQRGARASRHSPSTSRNLGVDSYDIFLTQEGVPEPEWSKHDFGELLRLAFGNGRLIGSADYPVINRLRSE